MFVTDTKYDVKLGASHRHVPVRQHVGVTPLIYFYLHLVTNISELRSLIVFIRVDSLPELKKGCKHSSQPLIFISDKIYLDIMTCFVSVKSPMVIM